MLESTAGDLASVIRRHLEQVDREIVDQQRLRARLHDVLDALNGPRTPSPSRKSLQS